MLVLSSLSSCIYWLFNFVSSIKQTFMLIFPPFLMKAVISMEYNFHSFWEYWEGNITCRITQNFYCSCSEYTLGPCRGWFAPSILDGTRTANLLERPWNPVLRVQSLQVLLVLKTEKPLPSPQLAVQGSCSRIGHLWQQGIYLFHEKP